MKRQPKPQPTNVPRRLQGADRDGWLDTESTPIARTPGSPQREDETFLEFKRGRPCVAMDCGSPCSGRRAPHHFPPKGRHRNGDDRLTVGICEAHHTEAHSGFGCGGWSVDRMEAEFGKAIGRDMCDYLDGN